jgi:small subunit ribosomal protein S17
MADAAKPKAIRKWRRRVIGVVTAAQKTPKTLRVVVQYRVKHPGYGKYVRHRTVLHAHDEKGEARQGDRVELAHCRPLSKTKNWRLVRVVIRAPQDQGSEPVETGAAGEA